MSFSNFNRLPIEYITLDAATPLVIILLGFIQVFVCAILGWDNKIYAYFLGPKSSSSSSSIHIEQSNLQVKEIKKTEDNDKRVCLNKGDLEIVFRRLGIFSEKFSGVSGNSMYGFRVTESGNFICGAIPTKRFKPTIEMFGGADCSTYRFEKSPLFFSTTDKIEEIVDSETMFNLFDEDAVAAKEEEVKAAFDVYDENKDGFIDEFELQRVLCGLGFKEGLKIDNCRKMIILADVNGDGKLDFNEFVNFLQNSL